MGKLQCLEGRKLRRNKRRKNSASYSGMLHMRIIKFLVNITRFSKSQDWNEARDQNLKAISGY
jgi:hypothetical protein